VLYWSYAIRHAALINNVLCDDDCISPYEQVYQEKFDYFQLHVPFCACYYLLPEHERENKVSPRALPARYLGIDPERNGHLLEVPGLDDRITTGFHVVFNEDLYFDQRTSFRGKTTRSTGAVGTELTSAVGGARRAVHVSKRSAAAAAAPHNTRARSAFRWYAWLLMNPMRSRSATIRVRCREGAALVPALVPPAEKLHQVMHAHSLLVLGVPLAASTHCAPLLHTALHDARFHATDSGHHLSVRVSSATGLFR